MTPGKFGLSNDVIGRLKSIFRGHGSIQRVILYGSRAKGNFRPGSDIDLTLVAPSMELSELLAIENEIDDLLIPQKVDLSLMHKIDNPDLLEHIERVGIEF